MIQPYIQSLKTKPLLTQTNLSAKLRAQLASRNLLLLDGATGSALDAAGIDVAPPLWSANALVDQLDTLTNVHQSYVTAGAHAVTANTFRCHHSNLACTPYETQSALLIARAIKSARDAAQGAAYVLGSVAPLADCYSPELTPNDSLLWHDHQLLSKTLADNQVDGILVETMPTIREACIATQAALQTDLPVLVSVVCGTDGNLLSGEPLAEAVQQLDALEPQAILINCTPAPIIADLLNVVRRNTACPFGAYANTGSYDPIADAWQQTDAVDPDCYADYAREWISAGATIVGGCCYTTPAHIAALQTLVTDY